MLIATKLEPADNDFGKMDEAGEADMSKNIDPAVEAIITNWNSTNRRVGLELRRLIFETAAKLPQVGKIHETLKWNQPAYLTMETGSGGTIRMGVTKGDGRLGLYFHCQTTLVETFRQLYSDQLVFEKNRAILLDPHHRLAYVPLQHCIGMALTYHANK